MSKDFITQNDRPQTMVIDAERRDQSQGITEEQEEYIIKRSKKIHKSNAIRNPSIGEIFNSDQESEHMDVVISSSSLPHKSSLNIISNKEISKCGVLGRLQ